MSEAPERIWVKWPSGYDATGLAFTVPGVGVRAEYIRADVSGALVAERDALTGELVEALQGLMDVCSSTMHSMSYDPDLVAQCDAAVAALAKAAAIRGGNDV